MVFVTAATRAMAPDATPDVTDVPCTVTVAPVDDTVGVTVTDDTLFRTVEVYEVVANANAGVRVAWLSTRPPSLLLVYTCGARVTVNVYVFVGPPPAVHTIAMIVSPPPT